MNDTLSPQRRRGASSQDGVALVVILLFTVVILMIIVSTTATMSLGARTGGVNERSAYQALLRAEGGINTFPHRYLAKMNSLPNDRKFRGTDWNVLNTWVAAQGLSTYEGSTLTVTGSPSSNVFSIQVRAEGSGSQKVVLQDFYANYRPGFGIRADAPLVSYPNVDVTGGARVEGESSSTSTGMLQVGKTTSAVTLPAVPALGSTLNVDVPVAKTLGERLLLSAGDYAKVGSITYKVSAVNAKAGTLRLSSLVSPASEVSLNAGTPIERIDSALTAPLIATSLTTSTINVSDPGYFIEGSKIAVGSYTGTVQSVDAVNKTVSVTWDSPITALPEGTPIRRDVRAVNSGYGITGEAQTVNGVTANDLRLRNMNPFNTSSNPDLFTYVLGQTKDQMLQVSPYHGWLPPTTAASEFDGNVSGITFIDGSLDLNGKKKDLCGSGLLIVKGNLTVNGTCSAGFSGAIYVMGDYDQQGNSTIKGAVIAEGATEIKAGTECVSIPPSESNPGGNDCDTKIAGTGQGNGKITFDRGALLAAGSLLQPPVFEPISGTWRQR